MIYRVKLEYSIRGLGRSEQTVLSGLNKGDEFNFGNNRNISVKIIDMNDSMVTLKFTKLSKNMMIPGGNNMVELHVGDVVTPVSLIIPHPHYEIKILEIWEEDERRLRYL